MFTYVTKFNTHMNCIHSNWNRCS